MKRRESDQPAGCEAGAKAERSDSREPTEPGWRPAPPAAPPVAQAGESGEDARPRRIGDYEVLEVVGQGGMGQVLLARQHQPVTRQVAIKVLRGAASPSSAAVARFEAEQQSLVPASSMRICWRSSSR